MGFKYVFVPANAADAMQEMEYASDIKTLEEDSFRPFVEKYFAGLGGSVDKQVLLKQLQERTGVDLQEQANKGEVSEEVVERILATTSVEIFPVQLPTEKTRFEGVSVYLDDKGISKELEENSRVSGIVQACGYPGQTFRGDCFIGRVYDDNEEEWRRTDFLLKDCSTDADWVRMTKEQRANRSSSDMASLASKVGTRNPAHITPGMLEAGAAEGETDQYRWSQADDLVEVTFKKEGIQKSDKGSVKVVFARQHLKVQLKGETLIDEPLCAPIVPDESTWTLSDGVLQVTLSKGDGDQPWAKLTKE